MLDKFINNRKNNWQRLEELLDETDRASLHNLSREEVRELGVLYRRTAADLAIARVESRDPKLIYYLNALSIRAHGKIYRAESQGLGMVKKFFRQDFPQTFRRNLNYILVAFACFAAAVIVGAATTWNDSNFAEFVALDGIEAAARSNHQWWLGINHEGNEVAASVIMTNNIGVAIRAFVTGAFFGVGSLMTMFFEGARFGSVFALCYKVNPAFGNALANFVIGHGVIELSCIFIVSGAGLMVGMAVLLPGDMSRLDALKVRGLDAIRITLGVAFLLVIAGIIEGFISPLPISPIIKWCIGLSSGAAMFSYLFLAGRETPSVSPKAAD